MRMTNPTTMRKLMTMTTKSIYDKSDDVDKQGENNNGDKIDNDGD